MTSIVVSWAPILQLNAPRRLSQIYKSGHYNPPRDNSQKIIGRIPPFWYIWWGGVVGTTRKEFLRDKKVQNYVSISHLKCKKSVSGGYKTKGWFQMQRITSFLHYLGNGNWPGIRGPKTQQPTPIFITTFSRRSSRIHLTTMRCHGSQLANMSNIHCVGMGVTVSMGLFWVKLG